MVSSTSCAAVTGATIPSPEQLAKQVRLAKLKVSACGDIDKVWPDNTENVLPKLQDNQKRVIVSKLLNPIVYVAFTDLEFPC